MKVSPTIFREYDIRGIAGKKFSQGEIDKYEKWYGSFPGITLTPEIGEAIGKAYGSIIRRGGGRRVVVGYELRPFGEELKNAFVKGIRSTGCTVVDAGVSLTPLIYFAVGFFRFDGGVNITGSHNVYFYNGFKMMKRNVWPLFGKEIQEMRAMIEREDFVQEARGGYETRDVYEAYERFLAEHIHVARPVTVVVDTGNGSAGMFAPKLFRKLGCNVRELYTEPDAAFPNHVPDPEAPQNMEDLGRKVQEESAELGVGLDADGDRAGFVNERGEFLSADLALLVFAKDVLSRHPGKKIVYDVKSSQLLEQLIPQYGGIPLMHRTGHAPIKETLRKDESVILGGEVSGHFYFVEDYFKIDDGLFASAKMLELFAKHKGSFSSLFEEIPFRVRTPEMKLGCQDEKKFEVVEKIAASLQAKFPSVLLDGIRIQVAEKGWGLIRASNTAPYLTIRVEGETKDEVLKIKNILADELEQFPEVQETLDREHVVSFTSRLGWR